MTDTVGWLVELSVKPGQLDAFKALMEEMVAGTAEEPGTRNYEWYISADGRTVHIWEKYADSDATLSHVTGFGEKWAPRFTDCVDMTRFVVYGNPTDAIKAVVGGWSPTYMQSWGGFAR